MYTTLIRVHHDTKDSLDEYISKDTKTYDAIIVKLIHKDHNRNKEGIVGGFHTTDQLSKPVDKTSQE